VLLAAIVAQAAGAARAAESEDTGAEERAKYAVDARTSRVLGEAREHLAAERYAEAQKTLGRLRLARLRPPARAQAQRLLGYVAYGQGDAGGAIAALEASLAEGGLPPSDQGDVLFQLAQIQATDGRWQPVVDTLGRWFATSPRPNAAAYFLLAVAHYQLGELDRALLPAKKAIAIAKSPQPAWYQLLLAIHLTAKDYAAAAPVLLELLTRHPNSGKGYWLQLSALYQTLGDDERSLAILELAHRQGLLGDDRDLRRLAQLRLSRQIPLRAAALLEEEIAAKRIEPDAEAYELLSSSWILAREAEKAEAPLAQAAALSPEGDLYLRLAQVHLVQEEWSEAAAALHRALEKGGLDDLSAAQLLLGVAYYNERKLSQARDWFARVHSEAARRQAQSWLEHIDRELAQQGAAPLGG
jgi:tetratricopeptide (TPR) repeat protein